VKYLSLYIIFLSISFSSFVFGADVGFFDGNRFFINQISGGFSINCYGQGCSSYGSASCRESYLFPSSWTRFYNYTKINAEKVRLVAIHEDGSINEKTARFDPESGTSTSDFNLWIHTLFQRPLLEIGQNRVEFFMLLEGEVVQAGHFNVAVIFAESRRCRYRSYYSYNHNDCMSPASLCRTYFREENLCRY
jgi:hypothetical protein